MKTLPPLRRLLLAVVLFGLAAGFVVGPLAWVIPAFLVGLVVLGDLLAALRRGVLGVDIIALLAIAGAIALGEDLAAVIIALMVAGGTALEEFAEARARRELAALVGRTPRIAHRHEEDRVVDIAVDAGTAKRRAADKARRNPSGRRHRRDRLKRLSTVGTQPASHYR